MSIQALPTPTAAPAVGAARAGLEEARSVALDRVAESELGELTAELAVVESQAAALKGAVLAEAERRRVAEKQAATGTDAWAAALTGDTREAMAGGLRIARLLQEKYHHAREAYAAGKLRTAQVRVIVNACEQAPPEATASQTAQAEELLVGKATGEASRSGRGLNPKRLRQAARRMYDLIDSELADRHEAILLGRETRHARAETYLQLNDNGDGTYSGKFTIPELHGNLFKAALERLTAPRRRSRLLGEDGTSQSVEDQAAPTTRHAWELAGAAFCELLEHLPTDGHTANGVTLLVTMKLADLMHDMDQDRDPGEPAGEPQQLQGWSYEPETGAATLDGGVRIHAGEARRLACNSGLVPAVLDTDSAPLDLGRESRLHDRYQRLALSVQHETCAVAGCERPFAWCEIHHPHPWSHGGRTDLDNALPICGWHHHRAHDPRYTLHRHPHHGWMLRPRK